MRIEYLSNLPESAPFIAEWLFSQWGHLTPGNSVEKTCNRLLEPADTQGLPITMIACIESTPVGVARLVAHDMKTRLDLSPWMASVYVSPEYRSQGIGKTLVSRICDQAKRMNFQILYLFTPDKESFYSEQGWNTLEKTEYLNLSVVLMCKLLAREKVKDIALLSVFPVMADDELILQTDSTFPADHTMGYSPYYRFKMMNKNGEEMGKITFRIGTTHNEVFFRGNIGFTVFEQFRGHYYASRACLLLAPIINHHKLNPVWLTCNTDNQASIKSIERIGAKFIGISKMQDDYPYVEHYPPAARIKRRYLWTPENMAKA